MFFSPHSFSFLHSPCVMSPPFRSLCSPRPFAAIAPLAHVARSFLPSLRSTGGQWARLTDTTSGLSGPTEAVLVFAWDEHWRSGLAAPRFASVGAVTAVCFVSLLRPDCLAAEVVAVLVGTTIGKSTMIYRPLTQLLRLFQVRPNSFIHYAYRRRLKPSRCRPFIVVPPNYIASLTVFSSEGSSRMWWVLMFVHVCLCPSVPILLEDLFRLFYAHLVLRSVSLPRSFADPIGSSSWPSIVPCCAPLPRPPSRKAQHS